MWQIGLMKVKMKLSGGFRTQTGAETFATLRSVVSTARKQGMNILRALTAGFVDPRLVRMKPARSSDQPRTDGNPTEGLGLFQRFKPWR